MENGYIVVFHE